MKPTKFFGDIYVLLIVIMLNPIILPCNGEVSSRDLELVKMITESNRTNLRVVNSFDCCYAWEMNTKQDDTDKVKRTKKTGRYSFEEGKLSCREQFVTEGFRSDFVSNGTEKRKRKYKEGAGTLSISSDPNSPVIPGIQSPWNQIDGGLSFRLDKLTEADGTIESVELVELNDNKHVAVSFKRPLTLPTGDVSSFPVTIWYSVEHGYLPIKCKFEWEGYPGLGEKTSGESIIHQVQKYDVNGNTVYLPQGFEEKVYKAGILSRTIRYNVDANTVQFNTSLPDELFKLEAEPTDIIYNYDLQLQIRGRDGRNVVQSFIDKSVGDIILEASKENEQLNHVSLDGNINLELVYVPRGDFIKGSPDTEIGYPARWLKRFQKKGKPTRPGNEGPPHKVIIEKGFYMGKYEVTCAQYRCFRPDYTRRPYDKRKMDLDNQPALVNWNDAIAFCKWLSKKTGLNVRLASETEWEYACRAGSNTRFFWGKREEDAGQYANVADKAYEKMWPDSAYCFVTDDGNAFLCPVGRYKPNKWDLYDMIGNAPEWCQDIYFENAYNKDLDRNKELQTDSKRIHRGGSWRSDIRSARSASRDYYTEVSERPPFIGFRVVIDK